MSAAPRVTRRAVSAGLGLGGVFAPSIVRAAPRVCRFSLDWAFSASSGFVLGAVREGYFRDENIDLRVSRGMGSSKVPIDIAAGAYDLGFGDFNSMVQFVADRPQTDIICVLMVYDGLPLAVTSLSDGKIHKPADCEGCVLAAPENDAGRQLFPVFAEFAGFDAAKVKWPERCARAARADARAQASGCDHRLHLIDLVRPARPSASPPTSRSSCAIAMPAFRFTRTAS